ncbi:hypothetical protein SAMN04488134_1056 [Amphibacillus marinus]|uniref:Carbohydrate deacetylase n=1 Tax=Amphibacillus marinus TaxID=872970 RepID=A0A1H8MUT3_9BACI|nr:chitin disaccharide deacetylase [Amphibacillus marinus]SEO21028.1 hypothetical protein SAMN04488134_1056 [Amphibacillus marinus]
MKIIFNADDYGLTKGITDGIIKSHKEGVVRSTTLMMNGQAVNYAIALAKENPTLAVGIHLVLTHGKPIAQDVPNLVNQSGHFKFAKSAISINEYELSDIETEFRAQIEQFLATGLKLDHIDSHHHVHGWPQLKTLMIKLAKDYQVPVRYVPSLKDQTDILFTDNIWLKFYKDELELDLFSQLKRIKAESVEVMVHPGIVDQALIDISSYTHDREKELAMLCTMEIPDWVNL